MFLLCVTIISKISRRVDEIWLKASLSYIFKEDKEKQEQYSEQNFERENYLTRILEELSPADVR